MEGGGGGGYYLMCLICDPGSEVRLYKRERKEGRRKINGMREKKKEIAGLHCCHCSPVLNAALELSNVVSLLQSLPEFSLPLAPRVQAEDEIVELLFLSA